MVRALPRAYRGGAGTTEKAVSQVCEPGFASEKGVAKNQGLT